MDSVVVALRFGPMNVASKHVTHSWCCRRRCRDPDILTLPTGAIHGIGGGVVLQYMSRAHIQRNAALDTRRFTTKSSWNVYQELTNAMASVHGDHGMGCEFRA